VDPLDRARRAARDADPDHWKEISNSIMSRLRSVVTPSDPILAFDERHTSVRDAEGSRTLVSARVVTAVLRRLMQGAPTHAPAEIRLTIAEERLTGVGVALVGSYGVDLIALADDLRADLMAAVAAQIGRDPDFGPGSVDIAFVDVVEGDPNCV